MSRTVAYDLYNSQPQLLLAALVLAGYAAQRAGRHGWRVRVVATAGLLKCYPFVLLPWFIWSGGGGARGRCRRLLGVTVFVLAAVAVTGRQPMARFSCAWDRYACRGGNRAYVSLFAAGVWSPIWGICMTTSTHLWEPSVGGRLPATRRGLRSL